MDKQYYYEAHHYRPGGAEENQYRYLDPAVMKHGRLNTLDIPESTEQTFQACEEDKLLCEALKRS